MDNSSLGFSTLEQQRNMGQGGRGVADRGALLPGPHSASQRGDPRHPEREDDGKGGPRGYDSAKKISGRKRVEVCDKGGHFIDALVMRASTDERTCAWGLLIQLKKSGLAQGLKTIFADAGFGGADFERDVQVEFGHTLEIVRRTPDQKGFAPLPSRWLIEQVFGCQGRYRRLSRDYEQNPRLSRATIQGANIHRWLQRLRPKPINDPPFRYRITL